MCFISYNPRGFSKSQKNVLSMITCQNAVGDKLPKLCNQENFILNDNSYKILQVLPKFHIVINPAIKDDLNTGRPKGGLFIAIPDCIKGLVKYVSGPLEAPSHHNNLTILKDSFDQLILSD